MRGRERPPPRFVLCVQQPTALFLPFGRQGTSSLHLQSPLGSWVLAFAVSSPSQSSLRSSRPSVRHSHAAIGSQAGDQTQAETFPQLEASERTQATAEQDVARSGVRQGGLLG